LLQEQFRRREAELERARILLASRPADIDPTRPPGTDALRPERDVISVRLLGSVAATVNGREVADWNSSKAKALFTYLVSHHQRRVGREQLIEALWPAGDIEAASNSLRVAVHSLRQALSVAAFGTAHQGRNAFLIFESGVYCFRPEVALHVDVDEFERHWMAGRALEPAGDRVGATREYEAAEFLYNGDFLQDDPYEEWSLLRREGLKDTYLTLVGRLSEASFEAGDYDACILRCQKVLEADPCREDTYQRLMRSHSLLGQPGRAHRWYEICIRVLKEELELPPSDETVGVYRDLFPKETSG